jgi:hypothetical protein
VAAKKEKAPVEKQKLDIPAQVSEAINAVAKLLGVAAVELWGIFVRQYIVRGAQELFTAFVLVVASYFLWPLIGLWILVPLAGALALCYGSIALLGNPKYYALNDISNRVRSFQKDVLVKELEKKTRPGNYISR